MKLIFATVLLALALPAFAAGGLPNPDLTPGATNSQATQETLKDTICKKGWAKTVRPPTSFTNSLKKSQIASYKYADKKTADYEEDHLIPLELGGCPDCPTNLWPQPRHGQWNAAKKDVLETLLKKKVCSGALPLSVAQKMIATDWVGAYKAYAIK
jgi:hypothetical protein